MDLIFKSMPDLKTPIPISLEQLKVLLNQSRIIRERDTLISDTIRLLEYQGRYILQEKTTKNEIMIRFFENEQDAEALFNARLEVYEKMWDGCGCKVDYYK
jgi:hypothetical protein